MDHSGQHKTHLDHGRPILSLRKRNRSFVLALLSIFHVRGTVSDPIAGTGHVHKPKLYYPVITIRPQILYIWAPPLGLCHGIAETVAQHLGKRGGRNLWMIPLGQVDCVIHTWLYQNKVAPLVYLLETYSLFSYLDLEYINSNIRIVVFAVQKIDTKVLGIHVIWYTEYFSIYIIYYSCMCECIVLTPKVVFRENLISSIYCINI